MFLIFFFSLEVVCLLKYMLLQLSSSFPAVKSVKGTGVLVEFVILGYIGALLEDSIN